MARKQKRSRQLRDSDAQAALDDLAVALMRAALADLDKDVAAADSGRVRRPRKRTAQRARKRKSAPAPQFDREVIRDLARCFARAAVDSMIHENAPAPASAGGRPTKKRTTKQEHVDNGKQ